MADISISTALTGLEGVTQGLQAIGASALNIASPETQKRSNDFSVALLGIKSSIDLVKDGFATASQAVKSAYEMMGGAALKAADEIYSMAQNAGMSTEQFSKWSLVAQQANGSAYDMVTAQRMLALKLADTTSGLSHANQILAGLGITSRDTNEIFIQLSDVFSQLPDGMLKSQLAAELFGRSSSNLVAILNQGPDAIRQIMGYSDQLGATWSTKTAAAANGFYDNLGLLEVATKGFGHAIADQAAPALQLFTGELVKVVANSGAFVSAGTVMGTVIKDFVAIAYSAVNGLEQIGTALAGVAAIVSGLVTEGFAGAKRAMSDFSDQLGTLRKQYTDDIHNLYSATGNTADGPDKAAKAYIDLTRQLLKAQNAVDGLTEKTKAQQQMYDAFGKDQEYVNERYQILGDLAGMVLQTFDDQTQSTKDLDAAYRSVMGPMENFYKWNEQLDRAISDGTMTAEQYGQHMADLAHKYYPDAIAATDRMRDAQYGFAKNWTNWMATEKANVLDWYDVATSSFGSVTSNFGRMVSNVIVQGKNMKEALSDFFKQILANFISMVAEMAAQKLLLNVLGGTSLGPSLGIGALQGVGAVAGAATPDALSASSGALTSYYYGGGSAGGASTLGVALPYAGGALLGLDAANRAVHGPNKTSAAVGGTAGAVIGGIFGGPLGAGVGAEIGTSLSKPISNIGSGIADIFGWADGGSFTVNKPSMFLAGEKGTEHVLITPQNANRTASNGSVSLNVHGPVIMDDITMAKLTKMLAREQARWK